MNFGFNQSVNFQGEVYHIQTEDGGLSNPVVTTHIFKGGAVIASLRTGYHDIIKSERLAVVIKEIMHEQHKTAFKDLLSGLFHK